jgi:hypothetical protein
LCLYLPQAVQLRDLLTAQLLLQLLLAAPVADGRCARITQQPLLFNAAREVSLAAFDRCLFEVADDKGCADPTGLIKGCVAPAVLHHHMCTSLLDQHTYL